MSQLVIIQIYAIHLICVYLVKGIITKIKQSLTKINYSIDFINKLTENIVSTIIGLIQIVNLLVPKLVTEIKQEEYKDKFDNIHGDLLSQYDEMCTDLSMYLKNLNI